MKKKLKSGFLSQGYEAPHAESVEAAQENILCASPVNGGLESIGSEDGAWDGLGGSPESFGSGDGVWDGVGGGPEEMKTKGGTW